MDAFVWGAEKENRRGGGSEKAWGRSEIWGSRPRGCMSGPCIFSPRTKQKHKTARKSNVANRWLRVDDCSWGGNEEKKGHWQFKKRQAAFDHAPAGLGFFFAFVFFFCATPSPLLCLLLMTISRGEGKGRGGGKRPPCNLKDSTRRWRLACSMVDARVVVAHDRSLVS